MISQSPRTPAQVAAALRTIADQLDAMPDRDELSTVHLGVGLRIQPLDAPDEVDRFALALFGEPGQSTEMHGGSWQRSSRPSVHVSGLDVAVFCGMPDPAVEAKRAELEALKAEIERLRSGGAS